MRHFTTFGTLLDSFSQIVSNEDREVLQSRFRDVVLPLLVMAITATTRSLLSATI